MVLTTTIDDAITSDWTSFITGKAGFRCFSDYFYAVGHRPDLTSDEVRTLLEAASVYIPVDHEDFTALFRPFVQKFLKLLSRMCVDPACDRPACTQHCFSGTRMEYVLDFCGLRGTLPSLAEDAAEIARDWRRAERKNEQAKIRRKERAEAKKAQAAN